MPFARLLEYLKAGLGARLHESAPVRPEQEAIYMTLFRRDIANAGVTDRFYPLGGAANYSLLYLLARCIVELKPDFVVELGAGQSTMLLDDMRRAGVWNGHRIIRSGERLSRLCALQLIERLDPRGFVVIIDDAERGGEMLLLDECMKRLGQSGVSFRKGQGACGRKRQAVLCGGDFVRAAYF